MGSHGWPFAQVDSFPGADEDPILHSEHVKDLYMKANPNYGGRSVLIVKKILLILNKSSSPRFTVPLLWDKKLHTIVNNESSELIRIFNQEFNDLIPAEKAAIDIYPKDLRPQIDELNAWIYHGINSMSFLQCFINDKFTSHIDGVYRSGFATAQAAYEKAVVEVFDALDKVEKILTGKDYLVGDKLTEADVRLWVTIVCLNLI